MSDDYSLGTALDMSSKMQDTVSTTKQNQEQAVGEIKGKVGNHAARKAAHINANVAQINAARAGIEMKAAAADRNFGMLKKGLTLVSSVVGGVVSGINDRKSNDVRADVAVQNGASAQRRLGPGGQAQQDMNATLDFKAAKTDNDNKLNDTRQEMGDLQQKYAGGGNWSADDQAKYKSLRSHEQSLEEMAGQLNVLTSFRANTAPLANIVIPGGENKNGNDTSFHADMQGYLKQAGMDDTQIQAFKEYNRLQSGLLADDERVSHQAAEDKLTKEGTGLGKTGDDLAEYVNKGMNERGKQFMSVGDNLQNNLDTVMSDQSAVKHMGPAANFVNAKADLDRMEKSGTASPKELTDQRSKVSHAEGEFNRDLKKDFWKGAFGQMIGQALGDALTSLPEMQQLSKTYVNAQIALSQASEEAGAAAKSAHDMELS